MAKLGEIKNNNFIKTVQGLMGKQLPVKVSYRLKKIVDAVNKESKIYEESRLELLKKYGKKKEDGTLDLDSEGLVSFEDENFAAFQAAILELNDVEVDVGTVSLNDLDGIKMSPQEVASVSFLIQE